MYRRRRGRTNAFAAAAGRKELQIELTRRVESRLVAY